MSNLLYKKNTYTLLMALCSLLFSCKKLIEVPNNDAGQLVIGQVFTDSLNAVNAVVGIYVNNFATGTTVLGPLNGAATLYTGLTSDELATSSTAIVDVQLSTNSLTQDNGAALDFWNRAYGASCIYQANVCIEQLKLMPATSISDRLRNQLIGECEVVRALCYLQLVNLYGPVPMILSSDYRENIDVHRMSVDSVYTQIKSDLLDASNIRLVAAYPSGVTRRPNKYVAMSLLSRVYLYRGQWDSAAYYSNEVITKSGIQLETDLTKMFLSTTKEGLWAAQNTNNTYSFSTPEAWNFLPGSATTIPKYYIGPYQLQAFEPGDKRKTTWLGVNNVTVGTTVTTYYYPAKYKNNFTRIGANTENYMLLRLTEQYLIHAEALAQRGSAPDIEAARTDLRPLRLRAGLTDVIAATKETMLTAIQHERQVELFCEGGHRWFDLKRTGTINTVLGAEKPAYWDPKGYDALFPINFNQILANPSMTQNDGYN